MATVAQTTRYNEAAKVKEYQRRALIAALKLDVGCVECGYRDHACALHFHHQPKTTKYKAVGQLLKSPIATIQAEIDKCVVLCANCHSVRTHIQTCPQ